jgi:hypothetical protein
VRQVAQEEVAAALARVYARPEFAERRLHPALQWVVDTWRAIRSWIADRLLSFGQFEDTAPVLFWLVIALLGVMLGATLAHLAIALRRTLRAQERHVSEPESTAPLGAEERDPAEWEGRARAAAAAGRLREAALALYHAVVLRLDQQGAVRFRPGKTAGEYRRETRAVATVGARFDGFLRIFHPLAFGPHRPTPAAWESLRSRAAELGSHA